MISFLCPSPCSLPYHIAMLVPNNSPTTQTMSAPNTYDTNATTPEWITQMDDTDNPLVPWNSTIEWEDFLLDSTASPWCIYDSQGHIRPVNESGPTDVAHFLMQFETAELGHAVPGFKVHIPAEPGYERFSREFCDEVAMVIRAERPWYVVVEVTSSPVAEGGRGWG